MGESNLRTDVAGIPARRALAVLRRNGRPAVAGQQTIALSTPSQALALDARDDDFPDFSWNQFPIIGDGETPMYDGQKVVVDAESAQHVIDDFNTRGVSVPIDLDHAVLYNPDKGLPAPAVGWIKHKSDGTGLAYKPNVGLVASEVEWTAEGARVVHDGSYRYHSPVFVVNSKTNQIVRLHSVALTNKPLTVNAPALRAASERLGENEMPQVSSESTNATDTTGDQLLTKMGEIRGAMVAAGLEVPEDANDVNALFDALIEAIKELKEVKTEVGAQRAMKWHTHFADRKPDRETVIATAEREFAQAKTAETKGGPKIICSEQAWIDESLRQARLRVSPH